MLSISAPRADTRNGLRHLEALLVASRSFLAPPISMASRVIPRRLVVPARVRTHLREPRVGAPPVRSQVDFIWSNTKFTVEVFRHSKDLYTVAANGSLLQAKLVITPAGSFVCSFAGESHKFHYDLEPGDRIRMTLDGKVVVLEKEKSAATPLSRFAKGRSMACAFKSVSSGRVGRDPSILSAPYAGKLTRYLVEDGAHLRRGEPFAEVRHVRR